MTQTPVNEFWWTWEPAATRVPIPREPWWRGRKVAQKATPERIWWIVGWKKILYELEKISYTCRCRFATNRMDWICMSREVMSWGRSKDDFLQWLVIPAPHTPARVCTSPGYQWSWIRVESTNRLGIGASRQRNDVEWWILKPTVV